MGKICLRMLLALAGMLAAGASAAPGWHVARATVRFRVKLGSRPTHEQAGYFVHLPDGGILPKPYPKTHILSGSSPVRSFVLWQNAESGLGLVFEAPSGGGDVLIYVSPARRLDTWTPDSGLTPSAILCTHPGRGSRADAAALAKLGAVPWNVHYRNRAGARRAPLSLPGELTGWPGPCTLYMLAHVTTRDPGETWIAPINFNGDSEVRVDGKALSPSKKNNKAGGTGQDVNLSQGLHRIELLGWAGSSNTRNGLMTLTWRTPKTPIRQLGGKRPKDLRYPGTSMWESRPLQGNEIVRSGSAAVTSCSSRDGRPLARIQLTALENFWLGNEKPLFVYKVSALTGGHPRNTRYEWNFGQGATAIKPETYWLVPGGQSQRIQLTASVDGKSSTCTVPFFPFTTRKTDINRPECRENFRRGALAVLEAFPSGTDPTQGWDASYWNNFFRTMEMNKGRSLLMHIFSVRWDKIKPKLSAERRQQLLDIFLDFLPRIDPDMAIKWTQRLESRSRDPQEAAMMQILRAEINLYYKGDPDAAREILNRILRKQGQDNVSEWARIRAGDIEFLAGNLDDAVKFYGGVQDRAKKTGGAAGWVTSGAKPGRRLKSPGLARSKAELKARRRPAKKDKTRAPGKRSFAIGRDGAIADWKKNAVADAAAAETIRSLIDQGYLLEAKGALRDWERRFPLSKVSSDFILREAHFYMKLEDWARAGAILEAYCEQVDASSFMPPAVKALLECKIRLKHPKEDIDEFCKKMKRKLEFHPIGQQIDQLRKIHERDSR